MHKYLLYNKTITVYTTNNSTFGHHDIEVLCVGIILDDSSLGGIVYKSN